VSSVAIAAHRLPEPGSQQRDVIFAFAYATWRTSVERGMCFSEDRLAQELLVHPRVRRLIVAETPRSLPIKLVKDRLRPPPRFPDGEHAWLYSPVRLRRRDPTGFRALERAYRAWGRQLRREAARRGLERPVLITTHPLVPGFAELDWVDSLTYYIYDDWASSRPLGRWWPAYEESYRRVRERGHAVAAVSEAIVEKVRPTGPHAVVPNGVDPVEWLFCGPPPAWFSQLSGPRALYVGSLDSRIDIEQLRRAARMLRDGSIVLVGPVLDPRHFAPLREEPNVHLRPPVSRGELSGLVHAADVCLLPHVSNTLTRAMSPLKLYEYLAGGAPVAALDLPPIRGISARVVIADELTDAVRDALALGPAPDGDRRRFAEANSWHRRQQRIVELALGAQAERRAPR
jgi:teichuronic acid biosynthesis glycosyltransferase TuaH